MFTKGLSKFIIRTDYTALPKPVVSKAKWAIFDFIGVAIAGSREMSGRIINELVRENEAQHQATVIAGGYKTSCSLAALANGTFGHVLDYDDCLDFPHVGLGHPTTGILPAVLAVGEKQEVSGKEWITAYCIGMEVYAKIGLLARDAFRADKGWEWTGVLGVMGATAAVAKLIRLDERQTMMALGIAASLSCGLTRNFGAMAGHLHAGNAARNGIEAALLAQKGFDASENIIEIQSGFYQLFTGHTEGAPQSEAKANIEALGNPWNIVDPGLMHKAFPCAHISHFGVDAALQLRRDHAIDWQNISGIEFRIPSILERVVSYNEPRTGIEAKFSLGHCMCRALVYGRIKIDDFRDDTYDDSAIKKLMAKLTYIVLEQRAGELPFGYQEVIVTMENGEVYSQKVDHPKGEPQNPLTEEDAMAKYEDCLLHADYGYQAAMQIKDHIFSLEKLDKIGKLTMLL